jgi:cytochrome c553
MKVVALLAAALAALAAQPPVLHAQTARLPPGAPPAVQACVGCHGTQGEGRPESGAPRIAGQSAPYLLKQLDSYADGSRRSRVMEPIARGLPPELRADVAAYYAGLAAPFDPGGRRPRPPERGRALATRGDDALGVAACRNCHGPGGVGGPPNIPYVAGLDADYLASELMAWKTGTRTNDAGLQMFTAVTPLTAQDIRAVAEYYASLPPPAPAPPDLVQAPPPRAAQAAGTAPAAQAGRQPAKRPGIEQAAPTRGGTQGPGGSDGGSGGGPAGGGRSDAGPAPGRQATGEPAGRAPSDARRRADAPWPRLGPAAGSGPSSPAPGDPARGRAIIATGAHGCAACHAIPGIRSPRGIVGPPLGGVGQRAFIAGQLPNRPDVLAAFLQNPPALVPSTGMPDVGLTAEEARHVAAYLATLGAAGER